jgi:cyclic pyranopterin phosphate synthase
VPEGFKWLPRKEILELEEIYRIVKIFAKMGVKRVKITGGEPLVRKGCDKLIKMLCKIRHLNDLSLTTNGILLPKMAGALFEAGLRRITVSLDTLNKKKYARLTGVEGLRNVLDGIRIAKETGFNPVKINVVVIKGRNEDEIEDFVRFAFVNNLHVRFIEFMPFLAEERWGLKKVYFAKQILQRIRKIRPVEKVAESYPETTYKFRDGEAKIGIISPVSRPFCKDCRRVRLTAHGFLRLCLFMSRMVDLKTPLRQKMPSKEIEQIIRHAVKSKPYRSHPMMDKVKEVMCRVGG